MNVQSRFNSLLREPLLRLNRRSPRICRDIRTWIERATGQPCRVLRPEEIVLRAPPLALQSEVHPDFASQLVDKTNELFLGVIDHARICGRDGLVVLPDGQFAWDYLTHDERRIRESPFYFNRFNRRVRRRHVPGQYFLLSGIWSTAYYHWMHDVLQRLWEYPSWLPPQTKLIVPADAGAKSLQYLQELGIGSDRIARQPHDEVWQVDQLWFAPPPVPTGHSAPVYARWLHRALVARIASDLSGKRLARLYISRKNALTRRVLNEAGLLALLASLGFQETVCEDLSCEETARLFYQADAVVAPHGAGLVNLFLTQPGARVLELLPSTAGGPTCYWTLCEALGHTYGYVNAGTGRGHDGDMDVSLDIVRSGLKLLGIE